NRSRRDFLKTAGAAAAFSMHLGSSRSLFSASPNEKLNIAVIGAQNRASGNIEGVLSENIVALCDVDTNYLGKRGEQFPNATTYQDYRKMLDKEANNIDAVVISTPDHIHGPATV